MDARDPVPGVAAVEGAALQIPCHEPPEEMDAREPAVLDQVERATGLAPEAELCWPLPLHQWVAAPGVAARLSRPAPPAQCVLVLADVKVEPP